jgi:hypothetical protein
VVAWGASAPTPAEAWGKASNATSDDRAGENSDNIWSNYSPDLTKQLLGRTHQASKLNQHRMSSKSRRPVDRPSQTI